jgi:cytochrome P450
MRETLRLWPTVPAIALKSKEDDVIGGKYFIPKVSDLIAFSTGRRANSFF